MLTNNATPQNDELAKTKKELMETKTTLQSVQREQIGLKQEVTSITARLDIILQLLLTKQNDQLQVTTDNVQNVEAVKQDDAEDSAIAADESTVTHTAIKDRVEHFNVGTTKMNCTNDALMKLSEAMTSLNWTPMELNDKTHIDDWLDFMEVYVTEKRITGLRLHNLLHALCKDTYRLWLQAQQTLPETWTDLRRVLKETFKPEINDHQRLVAITKMTQQPNEKPLKFFYRITAAYAKMKMKIPEEDQVSFVIQQMQPQVRHYLVSYHPETLLDLQKTLIKIPAWVTEVRSESGEVKPNYKSSPVANQTDNRPDDKPAASSETSEHQKRQKRKPTDDWLKNQTCYNCSRKGHLARDCDQPKRQKEPQVLITEDKDILHINVKVNGTTFDAPIDSGTWDCVISRHWLQEIAPGVEIEDYEGPQSTQADGTKIRPIGTARIRLITHGRHFMTQFKVFEQLGENCLLGINFLRAAKMVINFADSTAYFMSNPGYVIDLQPDRNRDNPPICPLWRVATDSTTEPFNVMNATQFEELQTLLDGQSDVFPGKAGRVNFAEEKIHFRQTPQPFAAKYKRQSPTIRREMEKMINELIKEDKIEATISEWGASFFLKRKANGKFRPILDYRKLNDQLKNDAYPMPRIDEILEFLAGKHYVSLLDGEAGFHQIPLHEEARDCTTFNCHKGAFRWKVLPFGLKNSSAIFQRVMTKVLGPLIGTVCMLYIDDIIVASRTWEDHIQALKRIFKALKKAGFALNRQKCFFCLPTMTILGVTISARGLHLKGEHTKAVTDYKRPTTRHQLQQFVGLANYFRRFVKNFAALARPLTLLLRKDQPYKWSPEAEQSFQELKTRIVSSDCLQLPDHEKPFQVETDASDVGLGAALTQNVNGQQRVLEFYSKTLTDAERKYTTFEKEALAVVSAIDRWRHYLEGQTFTLVTDCEALKWALSDTKSTGRTARWAVKLQAYDYVVKHRAGKLNAVPDALSRNPLPLCRIRDDPQIDLQDKTQLAAQQCGDEQVDKLRKVLLQLPQAQNLYSRKFIKNVQNNYEVHDDIIYYVDPTAKDYGRKFDKLRYVVPKKLRHTFLKLNHDVPTAGHLGVNKTLPRLRKIAFWPGMPRDVRRYVTSCHSCQLAKVSQKKAKGLLQPVIPSDILQMVGIDFTGPLPVTKGGNKYILVMVDYFSKWIWLVPTRHCTARAAAAKFVEHVVRPHGPPTYVVSDNGPAFVSKLFKTVMEETGSTHNRTCTYRPQSNATERVNRTVKGCLRAFVANNHSSWGPLLPSLEYAIRTVPHASTGQTPFFLMHLRDPHSALSSLCIPQDIPQHNIESFLEDRQLRMEEAYDLARAHLTEAARNAKIAYDRNRVPDTFQVGQLVKLKNHQLSDAAAGITKKLAPVYVAPYRVLARQGTKNLRVRSATASDSPTITVNVEDTEAYYDPATMETCATMDTPWADPVTGDEEFVPAAEDTTPEDEQGANESDTESESTVSDSDEEPTRLNPDNAPARPQRNKRLPARFRINWLGTDSYEPSLLPFAEAEEWIWDGLM